MFRSSNSKGQWFIMSAVVVSGIFLAMSILLDNFFSVDTSEVATLNSDLFLLSIEDGLDKTIEQSYCNNLEKNINEFVYFNKKELYSKGYIFDMKYKLDNCAFEIYFILVSSEKMDSWIGKRPKIYNVTADYTDNTNTSINNLTIRLVESIPYNVSGKGFIYDKDGFIDKFDFNVSKQEISNTTFFPSPIFVGSKPYVKIFGYLFVGERLFFI